MAPNADRLLIAGRPEAVNLDAMIGAVGRRLFGDAAAPIKIGRYEVLRRIGSGTHATVYAVLDRRLGREVALKLLHGGACPLAQERLRTEARALAAVDHPNLVPTYDTGVHEDGSGCRTSFLVMQRIEGPTLRGWMDRGLSTSPSEAISIAKGMALGLAAIHRAGLVHRDFKPSNVLLAAGSQPRIADLGLARACTTSAWSSTPATSAAAGSGSSSTPAVVGQAVGTPSYMAPEQHAAGKASPAADQFAYCIVLVELFTAQRPFTGCDIAALAAAKLRGPDPGVLRRVPRDFRAAVRRGLDPDPGQRWPSMLALLRALNEGRAGRRRAATRTLLAGGGVALVATSVSVVQPLMTERPVDAAAPLAGIWDAPVRAAVEVAMVAVSTPYARSTWARTAAELDRYAHEWTRMRARVHKATAIAGTGSAALLDRSLRCLRRAKGQLRATVHTLADADIGVVRHADALLQQLPPLSQCQDAKMLQQTSLPPLPRDAHAVAEIESRVATAKALVASGRYARAHAVLARAAALLEHVDHEPTGALLAFARGTVLERLGDYEAAEAALRDAILIGIRWDATELVRESASWLVFVVGVQLGRPETALAYRDLALGPAPRAGALSKVGGVYKELGRYLEAEQLYRRALALRLKSWTPGPLRGADIRTNLANVLAAQGRTSDAVIEYDRTLVRYEHTLGPLHPAVGASHYNLGLALYRQGKYVRAQRHAEQALANLQEALGPQHPQAAQARSLVGLALSAAGDFAAAEAEFRVVQAALTDALGSRHPQVAAAAGNLSNALQAQGRYTEAESTMRAALGTLTQALGTRHPTVATTRHNLANILRMQGKLAQAQRAYEGALAGRRELLGREHPATAASAHGLATVLLQAGLPERALVPAYAAWERRRRDDIPAERRARTAFVLARALWAAEPVAGARIRAVGLAQRAQQDYALAGQAFTEEAATVQHWLHALRRTPT